MIDRVTPSEKLSALAVDRLIQSGLLRADRREAIISRVAAGNMQGADWKLEIELASAKVDR